MKTVAAAIDFGTSKIVTLLAESSGFNRCDIIGSGTVPYDGYMNGGWNAPEQLETVVRNSITAAELEAKTRIKEVYIGVPCEYIRMVRAEAEVDIASQDDRVEEEDLDALADAAAEKLNLATLGGVVLHRTPANYFVDGGKRTMSPVGMRGKRLRGTTSYILADREFTMETRELLNGLGVTVLGFLSPSLGAALLLLPPEERDRAAILVDMGYLNTEVSVIEGDAMVYHAVLPVGGGHIAADLSTELQIPMRSAEQIKREYIFMPDEFDPEGDPEIIDDNGARLTFPRDLVKRVVENTVDEAVGMIDLTIKDAAQFLTARSQVYVTGGGIAMMRGGREYLAQKLGRPVKLSVAKAAKLNSPVFASSLGLVDLVFDSIEQRAPQEPGLPGRLADSLKGMFAKK